MRSGLACTGDTLYLGRLSRTCRLRARVGPREMTESRMEGLGLNRQNGRVRTNRMLEVVVRENGFVPVMHFLAVLTVTRASRSILSGRSDNPRFFDAPIEHSRCRSTAVSKVRRPQ